MNDNQIRTLFNQYVQSRIAIQKAFPELTIVSIDKLASAICGDDEVRVVLNNQENVNRSRRGRTKNETRVATSQLIREVIGKDVLRLQEIYDRLVQNGWPHENFSKPLSYLNNMVKRGCRGKNGQQKSFLEVKKGYFKVNDESTPIKRKKARVRRRRLDTAGLADAAKIVLQKDALSVKEISARINKYGLFAFTNKNPNNLITKVLGRNPEFERVKIGVYKLRNEDKTV